MARNGSGSYSLPSGNPVSNGQTLTDTLWNTTHSDIASALTQSVSSDGQTTITANLPMSGFKHTGVANGSASTDYAAYGQLTAAFVNSAFTGNATFAAPVSGTTLTVNGFSGATNLAVITASTNTTNYFAGTRLALQNSSATSGNFTGVSFVSQSGNDSAAIWSKITTHTSGAVVGSLSLATNNGSSVATERVSIAAAGNVTINAPTSGTALTINGNAAGNSMVSGSATGYVATTSITGASFTAQGPYGGSYALIDGTANISLYSTSGTLNIGFGSSLGAITSRFQIAPAGNVTINTPSSGDALTVAGNVNLSSGSGTLKVGGAITRFESAAITIVAGARQYSVAHGGPRLPDMLTVVFRCTSAINGYSVGDEVESYNVVGTGYIEPWANATNAGAVQNGTPQLLVSSGGSSFAATSANFEIRVKCIWL